MEFKFIRILLGTAAVIAVLAAAVNTSLPTGARAERILGSGANGAAETGASGSADGKGTTKKKGAKSPGRPSATTFFLRGKGPFTHQSDEVYATFEGQASCRSGKAWSMVAIFHVKDVTASSAYVSKIVATYRAPLKGKNVYLGAQSFYQGDGKHLLPNDVSKLVVVKGGGKLTQTHAINKRVSFAKGAATFQRRANVSQAPGTEASWCGGQPALEIKVRPR